MSNLGSSNVVVVRSADHSKTLLNALQNLFDSKHGTDFDFCWEGRSLRAHRTILELFLAPEIVRPVGNEQHVPEVKQEVPDDDCSSRGALHCLLEFLYKGEVHVPEEQLEELLRVAQEHDFQMLVDAIEQTCYFNNREVFENSCENGIQNTTSYRDVARFSAIQSKYKTKSPNQANLERQESFTKFQLNQVEAMLPLDCQEDSRSTESSPKSEYFNSLVPCESMIETTISKSLTKVGSKRALWVTEQPTAEPPLPKIELGTFCQYSGPECSKSSVDTKLIKIEADEVQDDFHSLMDNRLLDEGTIGSVDILQIQYSSDEGDDSLHERVTDGSCNLQTEGLEFKSSSQKSGSILGNEFQCVHCDFESPNKVEYCKHLCFVHGRSLLDDLGAKYKCPECGFSSLYLGNIRAHMLSKHTKEKPYACQYCSYAATLRNGLNRHLNTVHKLGVCLHVCETCGKRCRDRFKLQCHARTHTQERPFKCELCTFSANMKYNLKVHLLNVHKKS